MDQRDAAALADMAAGRGSTDLGAVARGVLHTHEWCLKLAAQLAKIQDQIEEE